MRDPDEPDPPPRTFGFKPKEFERLNQPAGSQAPMPSAQDLAKLAGGEPRAAAGKPAGPRPGDPNDVFSIRRELRAREHAEGGDRIAIKKVRSRRKRDYWLLLVAANGFFGAALYLTWGNVAAMVFSLAGIIISSLALTWVMWFVMSDY